MKIFLVSVLLAALLSGCGGAAQAEYVTDVLAEPERPEARQIAVDLPGEAALPTMEEGGRRYYLCDDYEITLETRPGGDLQATLEDLTGYSMEDLTVVETEAPGAKRYDLVWASAGETGEQLGRAAVLDDGNYHYTMTVLRDADTTESLQVVWQQVFSSFHLA